MKEFEENLLKYCCYETAQEFCDEALQNLLKNKRYREIVEKRKKIKNEYPNVKDILEGNHFPKLNMTESKKLYEFLMLQGEQYELERVEIFIRGMKEAYELFKKLDILK